MPPTPDVPAVDEIHQYTSDVADVARFMSELPPGWSFPTLYSAPYFEWKITRNPFGRSALFLRTRNGQPASHLGIAAKPGNPLVVGDARVGELCDGYTSSRFQRQGHFGALGRRVIEYFEASDAGESVIFGAPNDRSTPVLVRQCGCQLIESMRLEHVRLKSACRAVQWMADWPARLRRRVALEPADDEAASMKTIDALWEEAASQGWLVNKSGAWWQYRYVNATERYSTYFIRVGADIRGWVVVKRTASRWPMVCRTAICDVVGTSPEVEVAGLEAVLRDVAGPLDVVVAWTQRGTPLGDAADRMGFALLRDVPVVYADTSAFRRMMKAGNVPRLSLGDSDQV